MQTKVHWGSVHNVCVRLPVKRNHRTKHYRGNKIYKYENIADHIRYTAMYNVLVYIHR